ncbi:MAG: hypothetical protein FWB90_02095 [Fibromonadales bacterium]|nr:hypothetical protein [Fibromonadales bacterium]
MKKNYNIILVDEFCSATVREQIIRLHKKLEESGSLSQSATLKLNSFDLSDNNLFFVTLSKNKELKLRNLMGKINFKTNKVVIVPTGRENFFDFAMEYNICNVIHIKRLNELMLLGVLNDFFDENLNLDSFFRKEETIFENSYSLSGDVSMLRLIENSFADFINKIQDSIKNTFIINCHELVTNAIAYGVLGITAYTRDQSDKSPISYTNIHIPDGKKVEIRLMLNSSLYGISVKDFGGLLTTKRILERIRRQSVVAGETIPQGIEDYTGRGLAILSHHGLLMFTLKQGEFTEVTLISRLETAAMKKPISILATEL